MPQGAICDVSLETECKIMNELQKETVVSTYCFENCHSNSVSCRRGNPAPELSRGDPARGKEIPGIPCG